MTHLRPNPEGPERFTSDRTRRGPKDWTLAEYRRARTIHLRPNTHGPDGPTLDRTQEASQRLASDPTPSISVISLVTTPFSHVFLLVSMLLHSPPLP